MCVRAHFTSRVLFKLIITVIVIRLAYSFALKLYTVHVPVSGIMIVSMYLLPFSFLFFSSFFDFFLLFHFVVLAGENDDKKTKDQEFLSSEELMFILPLYLLCFPYVCGIWFLSFLLQEVKSSESELSSIKNSFQSTIYLGLYLCCFWGEYVFLLISLHPFPLSWASTSILTSILGLFLSSLQMFYYPGNPLLFLQYVCFLLLVCCGIQSDHSIIMTDLFAFLLLLSISLFMSFFLSLWL